MDQINAAQSLADVLRLFVSTSTSTPTTLALQELPQVSNLMLSDSDLFSCGMLFSLRITLLPVHSSFIHSCALWFGHRCLSPTQHRSCHAGWTQGPASPSHSPSPTSRRSSGSGAFPPENNTITKRSISIELFTMPGVHTKTIYCTGTD